MSYLINYLNSPEFKPQFYHPISVTSSENEMQQLKEELESKQNSIDFLKLQLKKATEDSHKNLIEQLKIKNRLLEEAQQALEVSVEQNSKLLEKITLLESELKIQNEIKQRNQERINKLTLYQENNEQEVRLLRAQNTILRNQMEEQEKGIKDNLFKPTQNSKKSSSKATSETKKSKLKDQLEKLQQIMKETQKPNADTSKHIPIESFFNPK